MRIALTHDWLIGMRGGERVLEALCGLYPEADIFTLLYDRSRVSGAIGARRVEASVLQRLPAVTSYYRYLLPLMPWAMQRLRLEGYDLVISSSHCVAKGVDLTRSRRRPLHICYCHTPMRYLYSESKDYFADGSRAWQKAGLNFVKPLLARWDEASSRSVDIFVANSENVRRRIERTYRRSAAVVYPPVDTAFFRPDPAPRKGYFLVVGALVPYKRADLAIEASRRLKAPLKIIGVGNDERRLRALARGAPVEFLGRQDDASLRRHYRECAALLYPQQEDFGIAAVEAIACATPVVAYARGGALETVTDGVTGVMFQEQTADGLARAMTQARRLPIDLAAFRASAARFDSAIFDRRFGAIVEKAWEERLAGHAARPREPAAACL